MICDQCGHECDGKEVDNGFAHAFGYHKRMVTVSECCEAPLAEGGCVEISRSEHTARKAFQGIQPGDRYRLLVYRHWRTGGPSWITSKRIKLR